VSDDPVELLRQANPVSLDALAANPGELAREQELYESIVSGTRRRQPERGRWLLAVAAVAAAALLATGVYVASRPAPVRPVAVGCYAGTDPQSSELLVHSERTTAPIAQCGQLWELGAVAPSQPAPLSACPVDDSTLVVVPGPTSACPMPRGASTTQPPGPSGAVNEAALDHLRTELARGVAQHQCLAPIAAQQFAGRTLAAVHLAGWTVEDVGTTTAAQPCALLYIHVEARAVSIIADPRPS
jgi:hypothetical protein